MVKILNEYGSDATLENEDEICPIDIAITEDIILAQSIESDVARATEYKTSPNRTLKLNLALRKT